MMKFCYMCILAIALWSCQDSEVNNDPLNTRPASNNTGASLTAKLQDQEYTSTHCEVKLDPNEENRLKITAVFNNNLELIIKISPYQGVKKYSAEDQVNQNASYNLNISLIDKLKSKGDGSGATCSSEDTDTFDEFVILTKNGSQITGEFKGTLFSVFDEDIKALGYESTLISGTFSFPAVITGDK